MVISSISNEDMQRAGIKMSRKENKVTKQPSPKPPKLEEVVDTNFGAPDRPSNWIGDPSKVSSVWTATRQEPVKTRTPAPTLNTPTMQDFADMEWMWTDQLQDMIDLAQVRVNSGESLTTQEQARLMKAWRLLQRQQQQQAVENPFIGMIEDAEARREAERARLRKTREQMVEREAMMANQEFERRAELQREQWEDLQQAWQQSLSFSWFGRSTYAADQAKEIQRKVNRNIQLLDAERNARIRRFEAQQRGADEATLSALDQTINNLEARNAEFSLAIAEQLNNFNQMNTANYQEKLQNIFTASKQMIDDSVPLTEDEQVLVDSYANLIIDNEWNVDNTMLETIPARLRPHVINTGAVVKSGIWQEPEYEVKDFQWKEWDNGMFYRTNPETWQLETSATRPTTETTGVSRTWFVKGVGSGTVTAYGTGANQFGLDVDGQIGDAINLAVDSEVVWIGNDPDWFGNYVIVEDDNGNKVRYAHLDSINVSEWDRVKAGSSIGTVGNTGYVIPWPQWDGSHVDITLFDKEGNALSPEEAEQYLNNIQSTEISPLAKMVIDWKIKESQIKDNVEDKEDVPKIMEEILQYRKENAKRQPAAVQNAEKISDVNDLLDYGRGSRKLSSAWVSWVWGNVADFNAKHNFIKDNMTLDSFIEAKEKWATFGAMSEWERDILRNAATKLDRRTSEKDYEAELVSIKSVMLWLPKDEVIKNKKRFLEIRENQSKKDATEWAKSLWNDALPLEGNIMQNVEQENIEDDPLWLFL